MAVIVKNPQQTTSAEPIKTSATIQPAKPVVYAGPGFRVLTHRIVLDTETYIKNSGAFKMKVENKGQVGITIFGACHIPSYGSEVFETGDTSLAFSEDASIQYDKHVPGDDINLVITLYKK